MGKVRDHLEVSLAEGERRFAACPRWRWRRRRKLANYVVYCEQLLSRYTGK
jgi:hypothetical protein